VEDEDGLDRFLGLLLVLLLVLVVVLPVYLLLLVVPFDFMPFFFREEDCADVDEVVPVVAVVVLLVALFAFAFGLAFELGLMVGVRGELDLILGIFLGGWTASTLISIDCCRCCWCGCCWR